MSKFFQNVCHFKTLLAGIGASLRTEERTNGRTDERTDGQTDVTLEIVF